MAMPDPNRSQVEGSGMVANGVPLYVAPLAEVKVTPGGARTVMLGSIDPTTLP